MGIIDRLSTLLKSNINDLISRAENPEKVLNQLITDMRSQLAKAKQEVAAAIADEKKLHAQLEKEKQTADEWERKAMLAVEQGRDDLAKQALMRHAEHLQHAQAMHETWMRQKAETETLKQSLRTLNDKIEEAKRKKNLLIARQKRAEAQERIHRTMSSMSDKSAFEHFERMASKIEETERKALAAAEINEELTGDDLSRQFEALEYHGSADQQLLDLKKKMGLLSAGKSDDRLQLMDGDSDIHDADIVDDEEDADAADGKSKR
jgi:phage shock protein A